MYTLHILTFSHIYPHVNGFKLYSSHIGGLPSQLDDVSLAFYFDYNAFLLRNILCMGICECQN